MVYTKIGRKKFNLVDLNYFCYCPRCGKETAVPEIFELVGDSDFCITDDVYCEECSEYFRTTRNFVSENIDEALHKMDDNTVNEIVKAITATM